MSTRPSSQPLLGLGSGWQITAVAAVLALGAVLALTLNGYWVFVLANVALLAIVGVGLNVLVGLTGQVSFGHVGFYAIGAYTMAILTTKTGLSFWLVWPIAAVIGGAFGALVALPALRVKGPYLAMITIAFGLIVEHSIVEASGLTGGQNGIMGLTAPSLGGLAQGERAMALLAIGAAALALAGYAWLSRGTWGAAMRAVRDAETAAESVGLNPLAIKTVAFAVSALCAAAAGALLAPLSGFVTPHTFGFVQSILFVLVVMIGGAGSVAGPLVGAIIVGLLPELLSGLEEYRLLFFGAMLLLVLWVAPDGVAGLVRRLRERLLPRSAAAAPAPASATLALSTRARQSHRSAGHHHAVRRPARRVRPALHRTGRPGHQPDRPQRRGQVHRAQHAGRLLPAHGGRLLTRRPGAAGAERHADLAPRRGAHVSNVAALRLAQRAGQRGDRHAARRARPAAGQRKAQRPRAHRTRSPAARLLRLHRPPRHTGRRPAPRGPAAGGNRPIARHRPRRPAARRARGRPLARRQTAPGHAAATHRRRGPDRAAGRTRHDPGDGHQPPGGGARCRGAAGGGHRC